MTDKTLNTTKSSKKKHITKKVKTKMVSLSLVVACSLSRASPGVKHQEDEDPASQDTPTQPYTVFYYK